MALKSSIWNNYVIMIVRIIATTAVFSVWCVYFTSNPDTKVNTNHITTGKITWNKSCLSVNQNISLLPAYNNSQTKIIRSTMLQHIIPPLFISSGGSGNTFIRVLIEYVTKIYTGSVYHGEFIDLGFVGSMYCGTETILVKYHGEHMGHTGARDIIRGERVCPQEATKQEFRKVHGKINHVAAIFLVRNPWDAFFALYQYWKGKKEHGMRHKAHIPLDGWNVQQFRDWIQEDIKKWIRNIDAFTVWRQINSPFIVVKFENIMNDDIEIKTNELLKIVKFLYRDEYYKQHEELFKKRISCVWSVSETDKRLNSMHRDKAMNGQLNKTYAYESLGEEFLCEMWMKLKLSAELFGYTSYQNMSCR